MQQLINLPLFGLNFGDEAGYHFADSVVAVRKNWCGQLEIDRTRNRLS